MPLEMLPRFLSGKPTTNLGTTRTLANRNVTKLVREYVAAHDATPININEVRDDLRKQGVKGQGSLALLGYTRDPEKRSRRETSPLRKGYWFF